jgi:tRNA(Ile)-lysidine synthetase-like protein
MRQRLPGDEMKPLRMNGKSLKLKKMFTDDKIDYITKNNIIVIMSHDTIISLFKYTIAFGFEKKVGRDIVLQIKRLENNKPN